MIRNQIERDMRKLLSFLVFLPLLFSSPASAAGPLSASRLYQMCTSSGNGDYYACDLYFQGFYSAYLISALQTRTYAFCGILSPGQIRSEFMKVMQDDPGSDREATVVILVALSARYSC